MTMTATLDEPKRMQCMEVWGGNHAVDTGVIMAGLDAWLYSRPHGQGSAGGDIHYVSSCAAGMITRLLVVDVAGHGPAVSDVAAHLRKLMRRYINYHDQTKFIHEIDREFAELQKAPGAFATAVAITFESVGNRFVMCNAGHPPPLRFSARRRRWEAMARPTDDSDSLANIPLGIDTDGRYSQVETNLDVGDLVLCYTDSLTESRSRDGELLGVEGLLRTLGQIDVTDLPRIIPTLLEKIERTREGNLSEDDVTALLFRPNGMLPRLPLRSYLLIPYYLIRSRISRLWGSGDSDPTTTS
jgi:serine phosphatase RsbU (regulator of sigma subunit)